MLARSLTFATLLAVTGPLLAANNDGPLAAELGKSRPLVVIAPSTADPTLRGLDEALKAPETQAGFKERNLVLFSIAGLVGKRDDKFLEQQATMALIRELKLGASKGTKVILIGKDGQQHMLKDEQNTDALDAQAVFKAVDGLPASEKAVSAPEPVASTATTTAKEAKPGKPVKPAVPAKPPKPLED
ncbi:DUF4174 domain-containing protein [Pseudomonas entomophila]|uniref:DUF4174 domain-containing protein n=1 Tax=Pseudomonas entomophila TaxID=312306 RepID=UPI0015E3A6F1|nr:DUF4174 domain-containing protein [Pseudomonas entomophila]MBA1189355.1 DUF4174 domain-containing protein [Pseudomonas entomophila]